MQVIKNNAIKIHLGFGNLGNIAIQLEKSPQYLTDKEIEKRINEIGLPVRSMSWSYIRKIAKVPPGTSHKRLSGMKKKIREIVKRLKKERRTYDK